MRKDIEIHIKTGDVTVSQHNIYKLRDFRWTTLATGPSRYLYAEVDIPATISEEAIRQGGFYVSIPYTPQYKEIMLRVRRVSNGGQNTYLNNMMAPEYLPLKDAVTGANNWFLVKCGLYGGEMKNAFASELIEVSERDFYVKLNNGYAELYSAFDSDFSVVNADRQNANCMLACHPGNNYRYPLTGVGLDRWINSGHINTSSLAEILQREFNNDGVSVKSAFYNYNTQQMELELTPN